LLAGQGTCRLIAGSRFSPVTADGICQSYEIREGNPYTPEDSDRVSQATDCVGFVGASSLERMSVEKSLESLTREFKSISVKR
jgi:predicted TIM-barrel enzyme